MMDKEDLIVRHENAEIILMKAKEKWNYDRHYNWFPLVSEELACNFDWFFIMEHFMEEQYHRVLKLLFKGSDAIYYVPLYSIEQSIYSFDNNQFETFRNYCTEYACFSENVSWIYYRSHEGTVSFAGTILNEAQRILSSKKESWNDLYYK